MVKARFNSPVQVFFPFVSRVPCAYWIVIDIDKFRPLYDSVKDNRGTFFLCGSQPLRKALHRLEQLHIAFGFEGTPTARRFHCIPCFAPPERNKRRRVRVSRLSPVG